MFLLYLSMLCMIYHVFEELQCNAYMNHKSMNCIYEKCRYLLHLAVKKLLQTNKQTNRNIYIKIQFQNSIERLSFLYQITDI